MKKLLALLLAASIATPSFAAGTKQVCHKKVIKGKTVQQCKTIKIHKKYKGTKISDVKPVKAPPKK